MNGTSDKLRAQHATCSPAGMFRPMPLDELGDYLRIMERGTDGWVSASYRKIRDVLERDGIIPPSE